MKAIVSTLARYKKLTIFVSLIITLFLTIAASSDSYDQGGKYRVYVVNLTKGQPFTPPVLATHDRDAELFDRGEEASFEVKEIAENGNLNPMVSLLTDNSAISDFAVAVAGDPPPLMPGAVVSADLQANSRHDVLSMVSMLICTNDGFAGIDSTRLPRRYKFRAIRAYDAGTEINTEDFADIVPPCPALTGVESTDAGTGASNPDLAENGVVRRHRGVNGFADLIPAIHDWQGPVGFMVIVRTD